MIRICILAALLAGAAPAFAQQAKTGDIRVEAAFARATPGGVKDGAAFMTVHNAGKQGDRLISAKSAGAASVELHSHVMDAGVAKMREVSGIEIPAGGKVELKPGGYHLMLFGLKAPLKEGTQVPLDLRFERAGTLSVMLPVLAIGSTGSAGHKGH